MRTFLTSAASFLSRQTRKAWLPLVVLGAACNPIYYSPPTLNTPQHERQGDFHLGLSGSALQIEAQGSYALTDQIGVMASHSYIAIGSKNDDYSDGYGDGSMFEGGVGYYRALEGRDRFSIYGLYGFGHLSNTFDETSNPQGRLTADIQRFAVQPMIGFHRGPVEWIFAMRYGLIAFDNARGDLVHNGDHQADYLNRRSRYWISEPSVTFRFGPERIRFQIQGGLNFNMTDYDFLQRRSHLTFGVMFRNRSRR